MHFEARSAAAFLTTVKWSRRFGISFLVCLLFATSARSERFSDDYGHECATLWRDRNFEFVTAGLCLASPLGRAVFSDHSCTTSDASSIALSEAALARVRTIQRREVFLGCLIDTAAETLEAAARNLVVNPGETGRAVREDADHVNVRAGPSTTFEVIDEIALGTPITVLERGLNPQGTHRWLRVSYPSTADGGDLEGFVYFRQVEAVISVDKGPGPWAAPFEDFPPGAETAATAVAWEIDPALIEKAPEGLARETLEVIFDEGPNFAGTAILTIWGCGTSCAAGGVLDLLTGTWADLPFVIHGDLGQDAPLVDYRPDSTLLVATGWLDDEELGAFPYHWNGHELYALAAAEDPPPPMTEQLRHGLDALEAGRPEEAIRRYRRALIDAQEGAVRVEALHGIAVAAREIGRLDKGLGAAYRAQEIDGNDPRIREYVASHDAAYLVANPPPTEFEAIAAPTLDNLDDLLGLLD